MGEEPTERSFAPVPSICNRSARTPAATDARAGRRHPGRCRRREHDCRAGQFVQLSSGRGVGRVGNPVVLAAVVTAAGGIAVGVLAWLSQRSGKRIDAREQAAERAVALAQQAADQLEEARLALLKVKDDHLAMLTADNEKLRAQVAELAAKVGEYEARPHRKDDGCVA